MKHLYTVAAIGVAVLLWRRGVAIEAAKNKITEAVPTDGSNWMADWWTRLNGGTDLQAPKSKNMGGSLIADPGTVGQRDAGFVPRWDGSLA